MIGNGAGYTCYASYLPIYMRPPGQPKNTNPTLCGSFLLLLNTPPIGMLVRHLERAVKGGWSYKFAKASDMTQ